MLVFLDVLLQQSRDFGLSSFFFWRGDGFGQTLGFSAVESQKRLLAGCCRRCFPSHRTIHLIGRLGLEVLIIPKPLAVWAIRLWQQHGAGSGSIQRFNRLQPALQLSTCAKMHLSIRNPPKDGLLALLGLSFLRASFFRFS